MREKCIFAGKVETMNPKGNPNIAEFGEATRLKPGCCDEIQSKGVEAAAEANRAAAIARKWLFSKGENGTLLDDVTLHQIKIALGNAKGNPTKAYEALMKVIGELMERLDINMTPADFVARARELREKTDD